MERSGETIDVATGPSRPTVVDTQLNYYLELVDGGVSIQYTGTAGDKRRPWKRTAVQITDIRGCESDYDLDKQGFRLVQHHSREQVFADEAKIRTDVYEETKQLLMDT
ncbi:hypothetical protein B0A55_07751 [Friedmanniomyces simplex]|uniref:Uncharacterized protein n=1 Tax=Friedmanniomyces simplex TaxID=329884 RepID=A0A4U0XA61_9PEZI|nr:hypothetical protein B0A55_07751 [Friedmanniomyces simplex]